MLNDQQKTMYTLGQIARCIWPGGDVPETILDQLLVKPATGLALATKHKAAAKADQDELSALMARLPADLSDPPRGVKIEGQGPFWTGYYHYLSALDHAAERTTDDLRVIGEALYGERWQTDVARDLGLTDARRVRQWLAGERPIPPGVWADLAGMLRQRQQTISQVLKSVE